MVPVFPEYAPSQPGVLRRLPRTLMESPALSPSWRYEQALIYQNCWEKDGSFSLPEWEQDPFVTGLYSYLRYNSAGPYLEDRRFNYAIEAVKGNRSRGSASKIKSLVVAGLDAEAIATRSWCEPESIEIFEKVFYDIRPWMNCIDFVASTIFPFVSERNEDLMARKERLWVASAFLLGLPGLEQIIHRKINSTTESLNEMSNMFKYLSITQGVEFLLAARARSTNFSEDHDRAIAVLQIPQDTIKNNDATHRINFLKGFTHTLNENSGGMIKKMTKIHADSPILAMSEIAVQLGVDPETVRPWADISEMATNNSGRETPRLLDYL